MDLGTGLAAGALIISSAGAIAAPYIGRHAAHRNAEAAQDTAAAEMRKAVAAEREQASADWARYCDAQQRDNNSLREQISDNVTRIEQVELRAEADREALHQSEKQLRLTLVYLRRIIRWINENLPGAHYPAPPPELEQEHVFLFRRPTDD